MYFRTGLNIGIRYFGTDWRVLFWSSHKAMTIIINLFELSWLSGDFTEYVDFGCPVAERLSKHGNKTCLTDLFA